MSRNKNVVHKKVKHEVRITQEMLMKMVADETSLIQPQVKECMDKMFEIIEKITFSPDCPTIFEFKFGSIGKLTLKPHTGRKAGTYKRPDGFGKGEMIEEVVLEEEPSYQNLSFDTFPKYREELRELSTLRSQKQNWFESVVVGVDEDGKKIKELRKYKGWKARGGKYYPLDAEV